MEKSFQAAAVDEKDVSFVQAFAYAAGSFLLAFTDIFGRQSSLSAVLLAGTSGFRIIFALFGSVTGCIARMSFGEAIPYITGLAAIAAFRLLLGHFGGRLIETASAIFAGICVFLPCAFAANDAHEIFIGFALGTLALVCTPAYSRVKRLLPRIGAYGAFPLARTDLAAIGLLYTVLVAALSGMAMVPFDPGIMLSAAAILYTSEYKKGFSSAAGILSAAGAAIGGEGATFSCIILAVSGLLIVLTERYSRLTRACALIFFTFAGVFLTGITEQSVTCAVSVLTCSLICAFMPDRLIPMRKTICCNVNSDAPYSAFGRRLSVMSEAIGEMNDALNKTAKALDKQDSGDISRVYINAAEQVCKGCKNNMQCWGSRYDRSADILNKAVLGIRSGALADENLLGGHFADICGQRRELARELNRQYAVFSSSQSVSRKIIEMRGLLSAQLDASRKMLDSVSEELSSENVYDKKASETMCALLTEYGLKDPSALAIMIEGRLTVDAYGYGRMNSGAELLHERLSFSLRKSFDPPMIAESECLTHVTISERSPFDAQIKVFSKSRSGNRHNGDCCDCFNDGHGHLYLLLSDGMGSGSRARIDSEFACGMLSRLLKAGIDLEASLEMLNTSLLVKSADESFATLDVCRVDLYTGEVGLYKAGGAETFVRCGRKFVRLSGSGVPFGVNIPASYTEKLFSLSDGDVIIMTSDGAELEQTWLEQLVMRDRSADIDAIIDTVGEALRLSDEKGKGDDITVIGAKITK